METKYVKEYREKLGNLTEEEKKLHELYLKKIANGELQGPPTYTPSIDKVQNQHYSDEGLTADTPNMNLFDYLYECNKEHLDDIALDWHVKVTYRELFENINKMKNAFLANGVKKGDIVSIAMTFTPETIYSIYALSSIGATFNLCDPRVPEATFVNYLNNVEKLNGKKSKMLLTFDLVIPKIEKLIRKTELLKVVSISPAQSIPKGLLAIKKVTDFFSGKAKKAPSINTSDPRFVNYSDFMNSDTSTIQEFNEKDANYRDQPAAIIYTSGTTGAPKGAVLSNGAVNSMAQRLSESLTNIKRGDKFLLIMPPFIAYGLVIGLHAQLCAGQRLVLVPDFSIANSKVLLPKLLKKHHPQTVMGVPNFINEIMEDKNVQNMDLSFLKNFIVGGDGITEQTETLGNQFFKEHGSSAVIAKGWGMTEVASCATYTKSDIDNRVGSVGIPTVKADIRILKTDGTGTDEIANIDDVEELSYNEKGEIFVAAPTRMLRYLDEEKQKGVFYESADGKTYVRSQDLGRLDENGNLIVDGRLKRIIVRPDGHNVAPFAIEELLDADTRIKKSAVVGRSAEEYAQGQWPVAYIELKDEFKNMGIEEIIKEELNKLQLEKLPPRDVANLYEFIDEMPLTDIGKVDYKKLQEKENKKEEEEAKSK